MTDESATTWSERHQGGSADAERREFERLAELMLHAQFRARRAEFGRIERPLCAGSLAALGGARLAFAAGLPGDLRVGFARPGATYPVQVRFSNASAGSGAGRELRGLALRIAVSEREHHDLLAATAPASHARDARQFVAFAHATAGGWPSRGWGIACLIHEFGLRETLRMLQARMTRRPCASLALETYWSCGAIRWGDAAVRYLLRPMPGTPPASRAFDGPDPLAAEFAARLRAGDICFDLFLQRFVDERQTPIEDASVAWSESVSPPLRVARLTLLRRDLAEARAERLEIEALGFNPWNTTDAFRPLGHINRARKAVYDAALAYRQGRRWRVEPPPLRNRVVGGAGRWALRRLNRRVPWHRLPLLASLLNLDALRHDLRRWNLIDPEPRETPPAARPLPPEITAEQRRHRSYDGRANDLAHPAMGAVGVAFGRNMAPAPQPLDEPNAALVCRALMDRKSFIPARRLNVFAAAWIQFQVHDWVNHARRRLGEVDLVVPLPDGHPDWANRPGGPPGREMRIAGNIPHPRATDASVFANRTSHWWDGSEVYGETAEHAVRLREGARLRLDGGYLPTDLRGHEVTGFSESWWLGLSAMHTLFAREHNVLCGELRRAYRDWSDERVYQTARLVVSALIAKIHTVEWTPAILGTPALDLGMKLNWSGPPSGAWLTRLGIWLTDVRALRGIPGTLPDHHCVPYSLTEEFTTVYRMHPLIPDNYVFLDGETGRQRSRAEFAAIAGDRADEQMRRIGLRDVLYSFGIAHPGAITLHNFPRALQRFRRDGEVIDLSVVDIMRARARRVPRYDAFRRGLRMAPVTRWEDMTASPETNRLLREVYGRIDRVDTVIGLLGETPPAGFGFSDTAFRIFLLMASRRLQSDRFLTVDFRPEIYSPLGMDWIERNTMTSVLLRHCPDLAPVLPCGASAFAPWRPVQ